jgi:hypothetical protein
MPVTGVQIEWRLTGAQKQCWECHRRIRSILSCSVAEISEKWNALWALSDGNINAMLSQAGSRTNYWFFVGSFQVFRRGRCVCWLSGNSITFVLIKATYQQQIISTTKGASQQNLAPKCDKLLELTHRLQNLMCSYATRRLARSGSIWI